MVCIGEFCFDENRQCVLISYLFRCLCMELVHERDDKIGLKYFWGAGVLNAWVVHSLAVPELLCFS